MRLRRGRAAEVEPQGAVRIRQGDLQATQRGRAHVQSDQGKATGGDALRQARRHLRVVRQFGVHQHCVERHVLNVNRA